uniref:Uncharacterized protein n=1 Tax=Aegilops tauschii subsp. strangulata TaxID=200361 RepID=A0A453NWW9_AEGTS
CSRLLLYILINLARLTYRQLSVTVFFSVGLMHSCKSAWTTEICV